MKEKRITILGEELTIRFNLAVQMAYEEISGKPFNVADLDSQKNSTALYMAAILTNNPDTTITLDKLIHEASGVEVTTLATAVIESMTQWMQVPDVIPSEKQQEGEQPKN